MSPDNGYETVIGLEVHAQLLTESKLFCSDATEYGAEPNTQTSPVSLGHPGTLPYLNRHALELAVRLGMACGCRIARRTYFARKNYFYPDLPKGYQISQQEGPICSGGRFRIHTPGGIREVRLNRIHLEEDAGKSLHDISPSHTCLDFNRAGTPLVEMVTEPDIRSAEEAFAFLNEVRRLVRWIGVCDGNMEQGSLRCDANISVRKRGETILGTRVEVKNLNSARNLKKAVEIESARLTAILEAGGTVRQETRGFDADRDTTFSIRTKEDADDYRYFPEPDLPPFTLTEEELARIAGGIPELPDAMAARFMADYGLGAYDAGQLCEERALADYFQRVLPSAGHAKPLANWLLGPVRSLLNERGLDTADCPIPTEHWRELIDLVEGGRISFSTASQRLLPLLMEEGNAGPMALALSWDLLQDAGADEVARWVEETLASMPDKVAEFRKGKKGLLGLFMGEVRRRSKGKADPMRVQETLLQKLNEKI
jgi:aspartyl-tRNA(Asn)/glutamyl-tRNA(Gln) amidotransferase subunit B